jgi:hypothetical protein
MIGEVQPHRAGDHPDHRPGSDRGSVGPRAPRGRRDGSPDGALGGRISDELWPRTAARPGGARAPVRGRSRARPGVTGAGSARVVSGWSRAASTRRAVRVSSVGAARRCDRAAPFGRPARVGPRTAPWTWSGAGGSGSRHQEGRHPGRVGVAAGESISTRRAADGRGLDGRSRVRSSHPFKDRRRPTRARPAPPSCSGDAGRGRGRRSRGPLRGRSALDPRAPIEVGLKPGPRPLSSPS